MPPERILLLTFTRRAAAEMLHRVETLRGSKPAKKPRPKSDAAGTASPRKVWGGTFHAVGARLLRIHGPAIGVDPRFTIHDQADSADLLDVLRTELQLAEKRKDFPKKGTCQAVHSGWTNSGMKLEAFLKASYPWCLKYLDGLRRLFQAYAERKRQQNVFDFDDLLLYWDKLLADPAAGEAVRRRFDCVLVDEYQDTNPVQARILQRLRPDGTGLTVVGDDAQSIYSFRGATVRNILDFPKQFPGTTVVKLEENYRSTEPILEATNAVIAQASEGYGKRLRSSRTEGKRPRLVACADEYAEARHVVERDPPAPQGGHPPEAAGRPVPGLAPQPGRGDGAGPAEDRLPQVRRAEVRRGGPRQGPGGVPAAGREPPRCRLRPAAAQAAAGHRPEEGPGHHGRVGRRRQPRFPVRVQGAGAAAAASWTAFVTLLRELTREPAQDVVSQIRRVLKFYTPLLRQAYDEPEQRLEDLRKLRDLGERFEDRASFLAELTLDPPTSTQDLAGAVGPGEGFPRPEHDPLGQGAGVGRGLRHQRHRGGHPVEPGRNDRPARRGAAPVLRRPDAGQDLADGDLPPLSLQLPGPLGRGLGRPADADAVPARCGSTLVPGRDRLTRPSAWSGACVVPEPAGAHPLLAGMAFGPQGSAPADIGARPR